MNLLIRGVSIEGGPAADVAVVGDRLAAPEAAGPDAATIDGSGLVLLPGLIDLHTHLREPGDGTAETIASGTRAAARGGYTTVFAMANNSPVTDSADRAETVAASAAREASADVVVVGALTRGLAGEQLADIAGMAASRAAVRYFSDDGACLTDPALMREALIAVRDAGGVLAQHSQEHALTPGAQMNEGARANRLGLPGWPPLAEEVIIARDAIMAHHLGARLHVCHVSTAGAVEVVRWAKAQGFPVTAEATPHHLLLTDELAGTDPQFKVNPPLRSLADRDAVRAGLVDGTIDVVATDHAPHPDASKATDWCHAPNGMLGLESALAVVADVFVATGRLSWSDVAQRMSRRPAEIGGIAAAPTRALTVGDEATFCLVDPAAGWTMRAADVASIGHNTPYAGHRFDARVVLTLRRGEVTHSLLGALAAGR